MLKRADQPPIGPGTGAERPVGEIVHQLVEDGKAYAFAELDHAKAVAGAKADAYKVPAILLGAAFLFLQAAVTVLCFAIYLSLIPPLGPFFAGLAAVLIALAIAGGLGWYALKLIKAAP
ncbi:phage holin family protein [Sphingomonas sp.]|uniref:phage holin family protein n=1 Tax=Sphingomonas sp. TaxID=28214 RepID=UPI00286E9FAB|nr:phage holin family protein [Sphingomonas sp.]